MIGSFRSNALSRYWTRGQDKGLRPEWRDKVQLILSRLDVIGRPQEMDIPGFEFHALKGEQRGRFAVWVSRNWRVTFGWDGTNAIGVDLEDYHGK